MFTLGSGLLFGSLGLVVDVGWAFFRREAAQTAADSAAQSAAARGVSLRRRRIHQLFGNQCGMLLDRVRMSFHAHDSSKQHSGGLSLRQGEWVHHGRAAESNFSVRRGYASDGNGRAHELLGDRASFGTDSAVILGRPGISKTAW